MVIKHDVYNNSGWNYRYFIFTKYYLKDKNDLKQEIEFVFKMIEIEADNEAPWNYL